MERVADPVIVSALLSLVLATRNKLSAVGYSQVSFTSAGALALANTYTGGTQRSLPPSTNLLLGIVHVLAICRQWATWGIQSLPVPHSTYTFSCPILKQCAISEHTESACPACEWHGIPYGSDGDQYCQCIRIQDAHLRRQENA